MKKAIAALPLLTLLVLAGCSNESSQTPSSQAPSSQTPSSQTPSSQKPSTSAPTEYEPVITEDTTVTIWTTIGQANRAPFDAALERLAELEPKLHVNNVYQSAGYDELRNMVVQGFAANNYPDLVYCYPDHVADYIDAGKAVNLDPYINNPTYGLTEEDKADYIEAFMAEGQEYSVEGTYSLPYSKSTEAMYYNRALLNNLDLSGIDPSINKGNPLNDAYFRNLTWDELFNKLCPALITLNDSLPADQKLLDFDANENVGIFGYDSDDNLFITLAQQYGYGYTGIDASGRGEILFNNDGMKELLTDFNSWARKRYIVSQGTTGSYTSNLFTAQQCLFSVSSTAGVGYLYNESTTPDVGVAPIPQAGGDHAKAQISQGPSFAVLDHGNDNQKLGAWIAYKFLTTPETCIDWSISTGYMGIRDSFYESEQYATASDTAEAGEGTEEMLDARNWEYYLTVTDNVFTSPVFKGSATVRDVVGGLMTQALNKANDFSDKATLDRFFNDAENQAKNAL